MNYFEAERKTAWNENFRLVREDPAAYFDLIAQSDWE